MRKVEVLLVTAEDCHFCAHAKEVLSRMAQRYPLSVSAIPWTSDAGRQLAQRDGIVFPPGIYVDGAFFGYGRLSEGKLQKWLWERQA